ncbi:MAG: 2-oxo acid dehydrogenase subunit E2 [Micrococcales bacterium]|nr:2-oxo acid dehydrogenase subunit E2 [Micrococcales bacterium]
MASAPPTTVSAPPAERPASGEVDGRYVSPLVRKLASNLGVDLAKVTGTGVGGRIRREDVEAAKPPPAPLAGLTGMTSAPDEAAQRLAYLSAKAADLPTEISSGTTTSLTQRTAVAEVDLTNAVQLIDQFAQPFAAREGAALTIEAFLIKATSEALKVHGQFNAAIENSTPTYFKKQNIGLAINSAGGQVVAVIHDAAGMGITNLAVAIARLRERAEAGGLVTDDLMGGSFTVTNPGGTGVLLSCPQVQSPQVAVLSVGDVSKRPVVVGDGVAVRSMAYLCLSYDSRLLDGADAARFLSTFKRRIETASHQSEISHGNEDR